MRTSQIFTHKQKLLYCIRRRLFSVDDDEEVCYARARPLFTRRNTRTLAYQEGFLELAYERQKVAPGVARTCSVLTAKWIKCLASKGGQVLITYFELPLALLSFSHYLHTYLSFRLLAFSFTHSSRQDHPYILDRKPPSPPGHPQSSPPRPVGRLLSLSITLHHTMQYTSHYTLSTYMFLFSVPSSLNFRSPYVHFYFPALAVTDNNRNRSLALVDRYDAVD